MRLKDCNNFHDFRELARRRLPGPIFNYIDGADDDEITVKGRRGAVRVWVLPRDHPMSGS